MNICKKLRLEIMKMRQHYENIKNEPGRNTSFGKYSIWDMEKKIKLKQDNGYKVGGIWLKNELVVWKITVRNSSGRYQVKPKNTENRSRNSTTQMSWREKSENKTGNNFYKNGEFSGIKRKQASI